MNDKIRPTHLARRAVVYLRQSTLRQVHEHRESTARQYDLRRRAVELGWPDEAVQVIDEDLGQSGSSTQGREGFRRLGEDVARGRVGAIFALEASRFARNSADWYRLLEICGLADVLIADEGGVYAPRDPNDRLLLGLKGQMSEAELYWMRLRLQGGKLSKARRGELYIQPPTGYQWDDATNRLRLDPDEEVQRGIHMVFERFRIDGSAHGVSAFLARNGLKIPSRSAATGEVSWVTPRLSPILNLLHNPLYTGTYVFGRREERVGLVDGEVRRRRVRRMMRDDWKVCLHDHHPAYITWEEFMANEDKLHQNRNNFFVPEQRGAAREGEALLPGLLLCGRCGHRMSVRYQGNLPQYECQAPMRNLGGSGRCWTVPGRVIDEAVAHAFLQAASPSEIELSLAVARAADTQAGELDRQWKLRMERLRYEAKLAERRYKAVDPDNRVVARTLERDWEERLQEIERAERELQDVRRREKIELSDADRDKVLALARDLPRVWRAATTAPAQRKTMLRMLVREVCLTPVDLPRRQTRVQILWETGTVTELLVDRPSRETACATPELAAARIRVLVEEGWNTEAIAADLNAGGLRTGKGRAWDIAAVRRAKVKLGLKGPPPNQPLPPRREDGAWSTQGVAARLGVTVNIVHYWVGRGWLTPIQGTSGQGRAAWYRLDDETIARLEEAKSVGYGPRGRAPNSRSTNQGEAL